ncbi:MAG: cupin domain-containing protein [Bacteroidia bacterium]|nr:cupin domain-containing protein [Bacteroidia bacterium]
MEIINLRNAPKVPFSLEGWKMYTSENAELIHLRLKPGESIDLHSNPFDVVFYVLKGTSTLYVNGDKAVLEADDTIYVKGGVMRGWTNHSTDEFRLLVVKLL